MYFELTIYSYVYVTKSITRNGSNNYYRIEAAKMYMKFQVLNFDLALYMHGTGKWKPFFC